MTMTWSEPNVEVQRFVPDEYVAVCVRGWLQCAYPGNGREPSHWPWPDNGGTNGVIDEFDDYNGQESGWWEDNEGQLHGLCGNNAFVAFNGDTAQGYEYVNGVADPNRPIYNISGYDLAVGTYTNVKWSSNSIGEFGNEEPGTVYHHIGRLIIELIDPNRANHS